MTMLPRLTLSMLLERARRLDPSPPVPGIWLDSLDGFKELRVHDQDRRTIITNDAQQIVVRLLVGWLTLATEGQRAFFLRVDTCGCAAFLVRVTEPSRIVVYGYCVHEFGSMASNAKPTN